MSDSEPVPFFYSNKCESLLADIHRPSKPKAREGRQVNEDKSIVRGSEEIPNVNEKSIRFLSGLLLVMTQTKDRLLKACPVIESISNYCLTHVPFMQGALLTPSYFESPGSFNPEIVRR